MKKLLSIVLSFVIIFSCLPFAASAHEIEEDPQKVRILENYSISPLSLVACSHTNTTIYLGRVVFENCTFTEYAYYEVCSNCNETIKNSTMFIPKNPETHTCTWVTQSCNGSTHWYQYKCTKCGSIRDVISSPCNGNCAEFNSLIYDEVK